MCRDSELGRSLRVATYRSAKLVLRPDDADPSVLSHEVEVLKQSPHEADQDPARADDSAREVDPINRPPPPVAED
jgi:hypothetical protein